MVAPFTADILGDLGCEVVGSAPNMGAARELVGGEEFDAAILDIHIRGERVFPLCDALAAKRIPFALTSGYADWELPERWRHVPRLLKPYTIGEVQDALASLLVTAN